MEPAKEHAAIWDNVLANDVLCEFRLAAVRFMLDIWVTFMVGELGVRGSGVVGALLTAETTPSS